jgi:GNAT superfamily N-acetyltransferase
MGWLVHRHGVPYFAEFGMDEQFEARVARVVAEFIEPSVRGHGVGARLVDECVTFARGRAYRALRLSTNDGLRAARHICERRGFRLVDERPYDARGRTLMRQTWELDLTS